MQRVVIIPEEEFNALLGRFAQLERRLARVERSMAEYVGTEEAMRITGLSRGTLLNWRRQGLIEHKGEGRKVLYLRGDLERMNEEASVPSPAMRRRRQLKQLQPLK